MEAVEVWLLHRVAHAVEAGGVSAELLTKLHTQMEGARERSQEEAHALAVQGMPSDWASLRTQRRKCWVPLRGNRPGRGSCCCAGSSRRG